MAKPYGPLRARLSPEAQAQAAAKARALLEEDAMQGEPLIRRYEQYNAETLEDLFALMAANIEDAFLLAGATPGVDYTRRDCFTLAAPFVLSMFQREGVPVTFAVEWPTAQTMRNNGDEGR